MDFNFLWDVHQQGQIGEARSEAKDAGRKAESAAAKLERMERQLDRVTIACQAMWEIIRDRGGATESMLKAKIEEIDLRDGRKDGKISGTVFECPSCGAKTNSKRKNCVICGEEVEGPHVFEG